MKVLFIGGTGNISSAVSKLLVSKGVELYHINRGNRDKIDGVTNFSVDINNTNDVLKHINGHQFDCVVNWIAYLPKDIERDFLLFKDKTQQYIFISSATVYQKPPQHYIVTEYCPLENPYWDYAQDKIACENLLMKLFKEQKFPVTIVRPSHTYETVIPVVIGGWTEYTIIDRIKKGLPIIVHGDGTSLWTITHSQDFAIGFEGLVSNSKAIGEAFHITSDDVMSWNQVYTTVAHAAGHEPKIVHLTSKVIADYADIKGFPSIRGNLFGDKTHSAIFDNSKIKKFVPNFKATIPFSKGIHDTLKWYEQDKKRMAINESTNVFMDGLAKLFIK
jgi:nucleoside-diphosphate-sugar epimerase